MSDEERDGNDRRSDTDERLRRLERLVADLDKMSAVTNANVNGLITTIDSRFKSFDRGQELILNKLEGFAPAAVMGDLAARVVVLERIKERTAGAVWFAWALGVTGVIGGIATIVKMIHG